MPKLGKLKAKTGVFWSYVSLDNLLITTKPKCSDYGKNMCDKTGHCINFHTNNPDVSIEKAKQSLVNCKQYRLTINQLSD
jgi:hypothetical protein